jgi:hypothetical protein
MNNKKQYEQIERFNSGELKGAELSDFLQQIHDNPELASEVEFNRKIDIFFIKNKEKIELREQLEQSYEKAILFEQKNRHTKIKQQSIFKLIMTYRIAAGFLLFAALGTLLYFMLIPSKNERLYSKYFSVYESDLAVRGNTVSVEDKFQKAMEAYNNADFLNSALLFNELCNSDSTNTEACFFKDISEMKNKNYDDAILSLNIIVKDSKSPYQEPAIWYLALCYLSENDIPNTKRVLQEIVKNPDNFYKDQAASLLIELE